MSDIKLTQKYSPQENETHFSPLTYHTDHSNYYPLEEEMVLSCATLSLCG